MRATRVEEPLPALVERARAGDRRAFDALVRRFQDMAVATALSWLRDPGAAEDAAQDAFLEAYTNLGQLREPAAFPGFLRRIVRKHCDRRTRAPRRSVATSAVADLAGPLAGTSDGREEAPDRRLDRRERALRLRAAIEELPETERLVLALHYLTGLPQREVALWLELPLSTVKKRLHSARGRLRGGMETMAEETLAGLRPSRDPHFSDVIRLFLAVREGDLATTCELVDRDPALLECEERWDADLTRQHALPVPTGASPLVRAAERGHAELVAALADRGASIDRPCECPGGESPLWAAVANGQLEAARVLLERGADPDRASFAGHAPLHVAVIRGDEDLARLLVAHGADPSRRDDRGRTPAERAREKGLDVLDEAARTAAGGRLLETGVRALDLFAPLAPGARVQTRFEPGLGGVVLLGELSRRFAARAGCAAVVWAGWGRREADRAEMVHAFEELALGEAARLVWSGPEEAEPERQRLVERALDEAVGLQGAGARDVLVVLFAQPGRAAELEAALPRTGPSAHGSIALVRAARDGDPSEDDAPLAPPWDVRIVFDRALAAIQHFPAIDPLRSRSRFRSPTHAGAEHLATAERAAACLAALRRAAPDLRLGEAGAGEDLGRALRLQAWLTQPFHTTEAFTGEPGATSALGSLLGEVRGLLEGRADGVPSASLRYRSCLPV